MNLPDPNVINITELCVINMDAFRNLIFATQLWVYIIVVVTIAEFITNRLAAISKKEKFWGKEVHISSKWIKWNERMTNFSLLMRLIAGLNLLELVINYAI